MPGPSRAPFIHVGGILALNPTLPDHPLGFPCKGRCQWECGWCRPPELLESRPWRWRSLAVSTELTEIYGFPLVIFPSVSSPPKSEKKILPANPATPTSKLFPRPGADASLNPPTPFPLMLPCRTTWLPIIRSRIR